MGRRRSIVGGILGLIATIVAFIFIFYAAFIALILVPIGVEEFYLRYCCLFGFGGTFVSLMGSIACFFNANVGAVLLTIATISVGVLLYFALFSFFLLIPLIGLSIATIIAWVTGH